MKITICFTEETICIPEVTPADGAGAIVEFQGVVRADEHGQRIGGLLYEIYEPMAERMVRRLAEELNVAHPCLAIQVIHRHGLIRVGEAAIFVRIESRHRSEAIRMLESFMNRLKNEVPIWKSGRVPC